MIEASRSRADFDAASNDRAPPLSDAPATCQRGASQVAHHGHAASLSGVSEGDARLKSKGNSVLKKLRFVTACVVAGALMSALSGSPANASPQNGDASDVIERVLQSTDPAAAYQQLSAEERTEFDYRMMPAETEESVEFWPADAVAERSARLGNVPGSDMTTLANGDVTILAYGCWYGKARGATKGGAGNTLYTYFTTLNWCYGSDGRMTARLYEADGETKTPGWRYDGVQNSNSAVIWPKAVAWAQHKFTLGIGLVDIKSDSRCQRVTGRQTGVAQYSTACGLV